MTETIDRNIFILNPCAGQGHADEKLIEEIKDAAASLDIDVEIHKTLDAGEATRYVNRILSETPETVRFFACGGDGTLNEVVCGAAGHPNAIVGCIPFGTGNDFVRNFPDAGDFKDIKAQLSGEIETIDLMEYQGVSARPGDMEDEISGGFCANMFNIGFDCNVVDMAAKLKKIPLISGSLAYMLGVLIILIKKKGANLRIELDGEEVHRGRLLLVTLANGCFCGGGVMSNPHAKLNDGFFDAQIVKNMSRLRFIRLFPNYSLGTHLDVEGVEKFINYKNVHNVRISSLGAPFKVSIDGEIKSLDRLMVGMQELCMKFSVPTKL
jgi:YegS/Rv2252/BmrU family lipid kinase